MAVNTTKLTDKFLQVKGFTANDWSTPGDLPGFATSGIHVKSITFNPSAANDVLIIKAGAPSQTSTTAAIATTATAPEIMHVKCSGDTDQRIKYFNRDFGTRMWPFIDLSDCTFSSAAKIRVEFELA